MFDAKELIEIYDNAKPDTCQAGLLAVAAHVRAQTLREAAGVCEAMVKEIVCPDECAEEIRKLLASARETGGAITLEQSAARLHEKYGDTLAKLDDKDGGK